MKPARFEYERASALDTCVSSLRSCDGFAKVLAGGQSLGPMMNLRLAQPDRLIDITGLTDLRRIELANDRLFVGALVTHAMIEDGALPDVSRGMMSAVAAGIGYRGVRNRGTVGGSIVHADPAADWPTALLVLGAGVHVQGVDGTRTVPIETFQLGPFTVALAPEEVVIGVDVAALSSSARWGYYKVCRKPGDFPTSIASLVTDPERDYARVALGATGGAPELLPIEPGQVDAWRKTPLSLADAVRLVAETEIDFDEHEAAIHALSLTRAVRAAFAP